MPSAFPTVLVKEILCGGPGRTHTGTDDPNGVVSGAKYDLYIQNALDGTVYIWIKTIEGGNTGWV